VCDGRRARTYQRWDAGVGAGGGKPGSIVRVCRSLDVDHHANVEPTVRGQHNNINEDCSDGTSGEVWRRGVLEDQPPPKNPERRV
jgi:hypothetical protein